MQKLTVIQQDECSLQEMDARLIVQVLINLLTIAINIRHPIRNYDYCKKRRLIWFP